MRLGDGRSRSSFFPVQIPFLPRSALYPERNPSSSPIRLMGPAVAAIFGGLVTSLIRAAGALLRGSAIRRLPH